MIEALSLRGRERQHMGGGRGMWRLFCKTAKAKTPGDWKLVYRGGNANCKNNKPFWEADYRISATNRLMHKAIDGVFKLKRHGLIARNHGCFFLRTRARQALGAPRLLLGRAPFRGEKSKPRQQLACKH